MAQPDADTSDNSQDAAAGVPAASAAPTTLKVVLQQRYLHTYRCFRRAYLKAAKEVDKELVKTCPSPSTFYRWLAGEVTKLPYPDHCTVLEAILPEWTVTELFQPYRPDGSSTEGAAAPRAGEVGDVGDCLAAAPAGEDNPRREPSATEPTLLKKLVKARHWQKRETFARQWDKVATTIDPQLVGACPQKTQFYRWLNGTILTTPYPDACIVLEAMFPGYTAEQLFQPPPPASAAPTQEPAPAATTTTPPAPVQSNDATQATEVTEPAPLTTTLPTSTPEPTGTDTAQSTTITTPPTSLETSAPARRGLAEGDNQIRQRIAGALLRWVGSVDRRILLQLLGWAGTAAASAAATSAAPLPSLTGLTVPAELDPDEVERLARAIGAPNRVDQQVITHLSAMLTHCKQQEDALGSRAILPLALAQEDLVLDLLADCPDEFRPQLLSLRSDLSTSIAYYYFELNDFDNAWHHHEQARIAARDAGSAELQIYALCEMIYTACWYGLTDVAGDLAGNARELARNTDDALLRAGAAQRAATAYAADGQHRACMVEFDRAQDVLVSAGRQAPTASPGYFFNEGYLLSHKSEGLLRLGRPQDAADSAAAGLARYDRSFVDGYAVCTLHLANGRLRCREIEEAARLIGHAATLAIRTRSARLAHQLRTTRARLQPWQDTPAVQALDDQLTAYHLSARPIV